jgi:ATP-dependent DNA helicase RecG
MSNFFDTPIEYLKGIGPAKADVLKKELQIYTYADLLKHYPFRYIDRTKFYKIKDISPDLPFIQLTGTIIHKEIVGQRQAKRLVVTIEDETGKLELVWFQGLKWIDKTVQYGNEYVVFGKPNYYGSRANIVHPEIELLKEHNKELATALQPVYNSTEKLKSFYMDSKGIMKAQRTLLNLCQDEISENLPDSLIGKYKMLSRKEALNQIHFPTDPKKLQRAEARLKFEELFLIQFKLLRNQRERKLRSKGNIFNKVGTNFNSFYKEKLPFDLTNAQKRVIKEIRQDTTTGYQMNRLLQGDVGSGKTIVALMTMLLAIDNGFQACMMAPTEILAQQHFQSLTELLNGIPVNIRLLTGSSRSKERKELLHQLKEGEIDILLGTHALIEDVVKFKNLGMVVIDEQHRFGVEQRAKLWKKNINPPHILVMTATPIPRTLAMTLYGDLDVSVIDELPAGRKPIQTIHQYDSQRLQLFSFLKKEIAKGRQVYIVYPLIKESEKLDLKDLTDGYESIMRAFPRPEYHVSILHGQMKSSDKDIEMKQFVEGKTNIMVATTVIEVGVNVPNASVMVIENAERFGLSQLHQLRGRVGRGAEQSYCILMSGDKLSSDAKTRIQTMVKTNNGFEIAEIDLQLRGPGDLQGTQQSGVLDLHIADLAKDQRLLQEARISAQELIEEDAELLLEKNRVLKNYLLNERKQKANWGKIS